MRIPGYYSIPETIQLSLFLVLQTHKNIYQIFSSSVNHKRFSFQREVTFWLPFVFDSPLSDLKASHWRNVTKILHLRSSMLLFRKSLKKNTL